jgi:polysaccharide pyruvyl transferase CsaB
MTEILVSGYYGFKNAGDEAILAGMIQAVREIEPEAAFTVISGKAAYTRSLHGVAAVSRGDFRAIWRALGRANLFVSGGGTLLQDITSFKSLSYYLSLIAMAKLHLKPAVIYAQGAGPVTKAYSKALIPSVVNAVDLITVRDPEAAETLKHLGVFRPPVHVTADPALALGPADPEWGASLLRETGVDLTRPVIGVSVRPWSLGRAPMQPGLAKALDRLATETGAQVVFIPLLEPADVGAAAAVAREMQTKAVLAQGDFTFRHVQAMIARCDLLVGMRYHALVFAAMNAVPLVGLSYDPKNDSFLRLIGERAAGSTDRLEAEAVLEAAHQAWSEADAFRARLRLKMAELTPLARRNAQFALELLKRREHQ